MVTASGFGAPLALPVTSIVPAAVGASDAWGPEGGEERCFKNAFGGEGKICNLNSFLLVSCSIWYHLVGEQIHSQTEVIGVFCRSAGADQNSEQALRALLGGLGAWLYGPRVGCLKCAPTPLHN